MKRAAAAPDVSTFPSVRDSSGEAVPLNLVTRYLCMAPYLRRVMLPKEITEPNTLSARRPLPVGRRYALRVLFGVEGGLPMPGVSIELVRRHCYAALLQTSLRDAAAIVSIIVTAFLAPLSTLVILILIVTAIALIRRTRLPLAPVIGGATGAAVALIWGWRSTQESYAAPLICLGVCFLIYLGDIAWSLRQVRKLSQKPSSPKVPASASTGITIMPSDTLAVDKDRWSEFTAIGQPNANAAAVDTSVYYDKDGIIGAGAESSPFPLTIPLDKTLNDDHAVKAFTAPELLAHIKQQITSQGIGDGKIHGYAYRPGSANGQRNPHDASHFTFGLPDLKVDTVKATPFPGAKEHPILGVPVARLDTGQTTVEDCSPSAHPDRRYVRATTVSWDGQLVVSVYVSAALQGHYLHMMIRPYVLAPIVSELKSADKLLKRHLFVRACAAVRLTAREFAAAAMTIRALTRNPRKREKVKDPRPAGRSTRERYALRYLENIHQEDDAQRIIRVMERKVVTATMDYLRECNISTGNYEERITYNIENHVIGGGAIYSGTFTGPIATATGPGATATGQGNAPTAASPPPK
jgi:hypothetical protein